jgi:hypothetical protein
MYTLGLALHSLLVLVPSLYFSIMPNAISAFSCIMRGFQ